MSDAPPAPPSRAKRRSPTSSFTSLSFSQQVLQSAMSGTSRKKTSTGEHHNRTPLSPPNHKDALRRYIDDRTTAGATTKSPRKVQQALRTYIDHMHTAPTTTGARAAAEDDARSQVAQWIDAVHQHKQLAVVSSSPRKASPRSQSHGPPPQGIRASPRSQQSHRIRGKEQQEQQKVSQVASPMSRRDSSNSSPCLPRDPTGNDDAPEQQQPPHTPAEPIAPHLHTESMLAADEPPQPQQHSIIPSQYASSSSGSSSSSQTPMPTEPPREEYSKSIVSSPKSQQSDGLRSHTTTTRKEITPEETSSLCVEASSSSSPRRNETTTSINEDPTESVVEYFSETSRIADAAAESTGKHPSFLRQPPCPERPVLATTAHETVQECASASPSSSPPQQAESSSPGACSSIQPQDHHRSSSLQAESSPDASASIQQPQDHDEVDPTTPRRAPPLPEPLDPEATPTPQRNGDFPLSPEYEESPLPDLLAAASAESYEEYIRQAPPPPPPPPPRPEESPRTVQQQPTTPVATSRGCTPFTVSLPLSQHRIALHELFGLLEDDVAVWNAWVDHVTTTSTSQQLPTADTVAQWLDDAHARNLSLWAADAFVDAYQQALADRAQESTSFWNSLIESLQRTMHSDDVGIETTTAPLPAVSSSYHQHSAQEVEVEIEAFGGYSRSEDAPDEDADAEPWWAVVERLGGTATTTMPPPTTYHPRKSPRDDDGTSPQAHNTSVDDDIDAFWTEQERRRIQATRRSTAFANSKSLLGQGNITTSGSSSSSSKRSSSSISNPTPQRLLNAMSKFSEQLQSDLNLRPRPINAVSSARQQLSRPGRSSKAKDAAALPSVAKNHWWRLPYDQRTESHEGFLTVDVYSLYSTSRIQSDRHELDNVPWESRGVKQRFLQTMTDRNWFGVLRKQPGNTVHVPPVCRPQSMEMPMTMSSDYWMDDQQDSPRKAAIAALGPEYAPYVGEGYDDDDDASWEATPECGKLINVVLQPGERVSRVTPDCTSSLRRSRWRKKYCR